MMNNDSFPLATATAPTWVEAVLADFDAFLQDHANCERKVSALAMSLIVKYPDRIKNIQPLIALAQEELDHFRQVYSIMAKRGVPLAKDTPDPYMAQLLGKMRHGRDDRYIDRMLVSSIVESRGAERFRLVGEAIDDSALSEFYLGLYKAELKHGHLFVGLLQTDYPEDVITARYAELVADEAAIVSGLDDRPALH